MNLSTQTNVYIGIFAITSIINLIAVSVAAGAFGFIGYLIVYFFFALPLALLFMYNLNCLSTGTCEIFSWILTIMSSLMLIISTLIMILSATTHYTASTQ